MALDPILDIFESLPPAGMPVGTKFVIYFSIVAVVLAILFTWLSTRGRNYPEQSIAINKSSVKLTTESDKILYSILELNAFKQMNDDLHDARDEGKVSNSGFLKLNKYFMSKIDVLRQSLSEMGAEEQPLTSARVEETIKNEPEAIKPMETPIQQPPVAMAELDNDEEDLADITRDLESRLSGGDDFLQRKPKTLPGFNGGELEAASQAQKTPSISPPPIKDAPVSTPPVSQPSAIPAPTPPISTPSVQVKKEARPNIPRPEMPKPSITPPVEPRPSKPKTPSSANPFKSVNSMEKPKDQTEEGTFTKSTSIAALRSDMLRELARLKKYIDEGDE